MASEPVLQVDPEEKRPEEPGRTGRVRRGISRFWQSLQPGPRARRGAAWGIAGAAAVAAAVVGIWFRPGLGRVLDVPAGILLALLFAVAICLGFILALKLLDLLPRFFGWIGFGAAGVLIFLGLEGFGLPLALGIAAALGVAVVEAFLGGALALLWSGEAGRPGRRRALWAVVLTALAVHVALIWWLFDRGSTEHLVKARRPDPVRVAPVTAADPSRPGPYKVLSLTYGSGTDRQRPEFGKDADLKTRSVDATPFVEGNEGWTVGVREWVWGFDFEKFPRNGRVWYPEGPGPFPLVLVVHGNHNMVDFSDPGYAWLGELLASRGFITVSVDENFFNGSWLGGLDKENDGRGWMLLKHLEVWREWNRTPGNPFHRKVDLDRIALIGHSRGGEAAGIAAAFNRLPRYPDDATVPLGFNFGIRAVVAIAPSDGQYKPANKPIPVTDVSYLVLQGGHDGDVSVFLGDRFYSRLEFKDGRHFKTALYSYRSNHGQWNTVWGDGDAGWPRSLTLNRETLLAPEEQRRLGAVAMSAFLEATLHDQPAYVRLFRDLRSAPGWLPKDLYITRFQDSTFRPLIDSEEDVDVATAALAGGRIDGRHFTLWKQEDLAFREGEGTKQNQVVYLGWKRAGGKPGPAATYSVRLPREPEAEWKPPTRSSLLVFSLADSGDEAPDPKEKGKKKKEKSDAEKEREEKEREARKERDRKEGKEPLDLSIELVADGGATVRLPLSRFRALPVPLESRFTRLPDESDLYGDAWEPVLQTFELPLQAFAAAKPGFDPAALREVRFVFDRSPEGVVILDDVGFAEEPSPPAPLPRAGEGSTAG
jgi:dienelactone hydrolase